jgi:hypothetical protein
MSTDLRTEALRLLGAAEHTLQNPEVDSWDSQRWAREIVSRLGPVVESPREVEYETD